MSISRTHTPTAAADALDLVARRPAIKAVVGFDGFIDAIIDVVDTRRSMKQDDYARLATIPAFAARVAAAAGKSTNLEMVVKEERFGGNGPLMAGALGRLGAAVTYIGAVGSEANPEVLHPIFAEFAARCERVTPVARPARTDALEFEDGKVMLGRPVNVQSITWTSLKKQLGLQAITDVMESASLISIVNWVQMGGVESIWQGLCTEVLPRLSAPRSRRVFIDLADPAKRTTDDITRALQLLRSMNDLVPVTLGLNLAEAERISAVVGVNPWHGRGMSTLGTVVESAAASIRGCIGLDCVVIHPREGAGAATADGTSAWVDGPFTATPRLSTGAGDHFNGGFSFAQIHKLPLDQCLAVGVAVSGAYVRDAASPTLARLIAFLRDLPPPEAR